jgi:hypothetical protein
VRHASFNETLSIDLTLPNLLTLSVGLGGFLLQGRMGWNYAVGLLPAGFLLLRR